MDARITNIRQQTNKENWIYNLPSLSWIKNNNYGNLCVCIGDKKKLNRVKVQIESWTNDLDQFINFDRSWILQHCM